MTFTKEQFRHDRRMVKDFHALLDLAPNEAWGYAAWGTLNRPRRCLSRFWKTFYKRKVTVLTILTTEAP